MRIDPAQPVTVTQPSFGAATSQVSASRSAFSKMAACAGYGLAAAATLRVPAAWASVPDDVPIIMKPWTLEKLGERIRQLIADGPAR